MACRAIPFQGLGCGSQGLRVSGVGSGFRALVFRGLRAIGGQAIRALASQHVSV